MKKLISALCLLFVLLNSFGQNLIVNPGFEEYTKCPRDKLNNDLEPHGVKGWYYGWYWNKCGMYYKEPRSGNGVAEDVFFSQTPYARSIGMLGTLSSTLIKDQCYYFEMYVCLSNHQKSGIIAIDAICVEFIASNKFSLKDSLRDAQICSPKGKIINDTLNWTKVSGYFKAKGNEKFIIIGEFKPRKEVKYQMIYPYTYKKAIKKGYKKEAYNFGCYYIDDLLLIPAEVQDSCSTK